MKEMEIPWEVATRVVDPVTTDPNGEAHRKVGNTPALLQPWYVTGLVDGEGSFLVSFSVRKKFQTGVEVRPSFALAQHQRNRLILERVREFFQCGAIRFNTRDQTYKYEVRSVQNLVTQILPHFVKYPLQTSKRKDFELLCEICRLIENRTHLSTDGLQQIINLAYQMNNLGARRYVKQELLQKMKV